MKKNTYLSLICMLLTTYSYAQIPVEIQDEKVIQINKLPARTMIWPSPDKQRAEKESYDNAEWVKSLNGRWNR